MDRRRFLIMSVSGGAWFVALWKLYSRYVPEISPPRLRVSDYLRSGEQAALQAITPNAQIQTHRVLQFPLQLGQGPIGLRPHPSAQALFYLRRHPADRAVPLLLAFHLPGPSTRRRDLLRIAQAPTEVLRQFL